MIQIRSTRRLILAALIVGTVTALATISAEAQPLIITDPPGDAVIRRTDDGNNGPINPATQRLPDIVEMHLGTFAPVDPSQDLFAGCWSAGGGFLRFDLVVSGLINPPGPLAFQDFTPVYAPFLYGPNPIMGFIEFDLDADENTGGELDAPNYRYLGNVGRFGGAPQELRFAGRFALDDTAFDENILTAPFIEKSGEEFHIAFMGEEIESICVKTEKAGGNPAIFEAGEKWWVSGKLFHRAHGFRQFLLMCSGGKGEYKPEVILQFAHDVQSNQTTISLVYPLMNEASAAMAGPCTPAEDNDGCDDDQNSIEEALDDLQFSAEYASYNDQLDPEFQLLADWEYKAPQDYLDPKTWRVAALVGTAYAVQQGSARYIWTDIWPNVRLGDFNGDCSLDSSDQSALAAYISAHDGMHDFDEDGPNNGHIRLSDFARSFSIYDTNYDGSLRTDDGLVAGDMDLNHTLDLNDVGPFVDALIDPGVYASTHGGVNPVLRGDMNCDGVLDGADIGIFVLKLLN